MAETKIWYFVEGGNLCRLEKIHEHHLPKTSARGRQTCSISVSYNSKPEVEFAKISTSFFRAHRTVQNVL